jgi:hypothetical protein
VVLDATQTGGAICACGITLVIDRSEADVFALSGMGVARGDRREWPTRTKQRLAGGRWYYWYGGCSAVVGVERMVQSTQARMQPGCGSGSGSGSGSAVGDTVDGSLRSLEFGANAGASNC